MRRLLAYVAFLAACPPPGPPAPVPPDADAAPTPPPAPTMVDAGSADCRLACQLLATVCGPQQPDCPVVFTQIENANLIREPSGKALTCADIAHGASKADVRALGVSCP